MGGDLEPMKNPVVNSVEIENCSPEQAWEKIANVEGWKNWRKVDPKVSTDAANDHLDVGETFKWNAGGAGIQSNVTEAKRGEFFTWKGAAACGLLRAHHRWLFQATDGGSCKVSCEEEMSGPLKFMMGNSTISKSNQEWLEELKASF